MSAEIQRPNLNLFPPGLIKSAIAARLSSSGAHLPLREGIEHIAALWDAAHKRANQYYEDEPWDVYHNHEAVISCYTTAAEVAFTSGQYDLAYQALGAAEGDVYVDGFREMLQAPISRTRERLGLGKVFFMVDFDHTLAQSTIAHERLQGATLEALPESVKEQLGYSGFREVFEMAYQDHQQETGMHNPEAMLNYLARYLGLQEIPQGMSDAYMAYCDAFQDSLFMGARAVLGRLGEIGGTSILTFGDELLQRVSIYQSGITSFAGKGNVVVVQKKSPDAILAALTSVGYEGSGYVIGIGDRPSDAAAIKAFDPEAISIRVRHPAGKYSLEEPKKVEEIPDFEFRTLIHMDVNLHAVFKKMLGR